MNITGLNIIDPRTSGMYVDPWVEIRVDEEVEETGDARLHQSNNWRVVPCGPFTAVEYKSTDGWYPSADLGRFNTLDIYREQLIEVKVVHENFIDNLTIGMARAKRLIRKYEPDWNIVINETAALRGRVAWRVERIKLSCFGGHPSTHKCRLDPVTTTWYSGAHVPLCSYHLKTHNDNVRDKRINK